MCARSRLLNAHHTESFLPWAHSRADCMHCQTWTLPCCTAMTCTWSSFCESHAGVQDIVFSFPVECKGGRWSIVQGLQIDDYTAGKLKATGDELVEEKALALQCLEEQS